MSTPRAACPLCAGGATLLPIASRRKPVAFYLCRWCGHMWMAPKVSVNRPDNDGTIVGRTSAQAPASD